MNNLQEIQVKKRLQFLLIAAALVPVLASARPANAACFSDSLRYVEDGVAGGTPAYRNNANLDLAEYGLIFRDSTVANNASGEPCSQRAAQKLLTKVRATLNTSTHTDPFRGNVGAYQDWLQGANVALIFASALAIGANGDLTTALDNELIRIRDSYTNNPVPYGKSPDCGYAGTKKVNFQDAPRWTVPDTCMDDYSVGASGFGFIAAYEYKRGRSHTTYVSKTWEAIDKTFSFNDSICLHKPSAPMIAVDRGPCNSLSITDLTSGQAEVLAMNGNFFENIPYGLGLMTSVSAALIGLEEAGAIPDVTQALSASQKAIAMALFDEGQRKTESAGNAFKGSRDSTVAGTCARFTDGGWFVGRTNDQPCSTYGYLPKMYPLATFYSRYAIGTPKSQVTDLGTVQTAYKFDQFVDALFSSTDMNEFFNQGRRATYYDLGYLWHVQRPRLLPRFGALNDRSPIGYLDGIDAAGCASGWTCDPDAPTFSNKVDFYTFDGVTAQYIQSTLANGGSEAAVNSLCGGGTAHRFRACLPASTKGKLIYAYGLDASGRGASNLPGYACANNPACTW